MLLNFLEQITKNSDISLTESIMDGYMTIFEATLAPIEYNNLFGQRATFTTDKNNVIMVGLDIDDNVAEVMFSTNGKYSGEGHDDPQILRGVVYVVHDLVKKINEDTEFGSKIDTLTFYGTEEVFKININTPEIKNHFKTLYNYVGELNKTLKNKRDNFTDGILRKSYELITYINKRLGTITSNEKSTLAKLKIEHVCHFAIVTINKYTDYVDDDDELSVNAVSYLKTLTDNMIYELGQIIDIINEAEMEYKKKKDGMTKRSEAYKTLTRRYFPEIDIEEDGNNVTLHLPYLNDDDMEI